MFTITCLLYRKCKPVRIFLRIFLCSCCLSFAHSYPTSSKGPKLPISSYRWLFLAFVVHTCYFSTHRVIRSFLSTEQVPYTVLLCRQHSYLISSELSQSQNAKFGIYRKENVFQSRICAVNSKGKSGGGIGFGGKILSRRYQQGAQVRSLSQQLQCEN